MIETERGSLLLSLLLVLVLTILGAGILLQSSLENKAARHAAVSTQALWAAEAGLHQILWELRHNDCRGLFIKEGVLSGDCPSCETGTCFAEGQITEQCRYFVRADGPKKQISSTGSCAFGRGTDGIKRKITADLDLDQPKGYSSWEDL